MLKAVIMDFDGVIIDTEVVWYRIFVDWFRHNLSYELTIEEFLSCVGSGPDDLFDALERDRQITVDRDQFAADTAALFVAGSSNLPPKAGVVDFITAVKARGLKLALATSATRLKPFKHLTRLGLIDHFDELITAEDAARIKPAPDLFLKAAERLDTCPSEILVVEDSLNGFIAANAAGMRALMVPNEVTRHSRFEGCYRRVDSLAEVTLDELTADF